MLRHLVLVTVLAVAMAQGPAPKPENRESSYANYDPAYQTYNTQQQYPYYQPAPSKFSVEKLVSGLVLPSATDILTGIVYIVAVAGVAGVVLISIALVLKIFSLKIPLIKKLKQKVISKVKTVDPDHVGRMLETAWETLLNSLQKYEMF